MVRAYYAPMMNLLIEKQTADSKPRRRFLFYPRNAVREKLFGWQSTVIETFRQELTDFIALSRDGDPGRIADGYAGFRAVEIANAVYSSSVEGRQITLSTGPSVSAGRLRSDAASCGASLKQA